MTPDTYYFTDLGISSTYTSSIGVIPHYFKKRKDAAYTGLGLGVGIAFTAYPYITESVFSTFGFRDGILCLLPVFICSIAAAVVFVPQLPAEKPESFPQLMNSYLQTAKHFVTPFYLINATLMMGSRSGFAVNYFAFLSSHFEQRVAVISYTIHGVSFLFSMNLFTLYGLKFNGNYLVFHLLTCFVFGNRYLHRPHYSECLHNLRCVSICWHLLRIIIWVQRQCYSTSLPIEGCDWFIWTDRGFGRIWSLCHSLCSWAY